MTSMASTTGETNRASAIDSSRPNVFIHTNHRQMLGAIVSQYSMKRNAANPDEFDVHLIEHKDYDFFEACIDQLQLEHFQIKLF